MAHSYETDGAAIYRASFATIRAEADLGAIPADLEKLAVRLIHACGMVDLVEDLAWTPDVVSAGRAALAAGATELGLDPAQAERLAVQMVEGAGALAAHLSEVVEQLRIAMFCTGSGDLAALRRAPLAG